MRVQDLIIEYFQQVTEYSTNKTYDYKIVQKRVNEFGKKVRNLNNPIEEIATALEGYVDNPCEGHLTLWLRVAEIHPSVKYITALCKILEQENNCIWHEGIIYIFEKLKDPRTISALEKVIGHNLNYENTKFSKSRNIGIFAEKLS